jgi:hypothetical protein
MKSMVGSELEDHALERVQFARQDSKDEGV